MGNQPTKEELEAGRSLPKKKREKGRRESTKNRGDAVETKVLAVAVKQQPRTVGTAKKNDDKNAPSVGTAAAGGAAKKANKKVPIDKGATKPEELVQTSVLAVAVKKPTPAAVVAEDGNGRDRDLAKQGDIQPIRTPPVANANSEEPVSDEKNQAAAAAAAGVIADKGESTDGKLQKAMEPKEEVKEVLQPPQEPEVVTAAAAQPTTEKKEQVPPTETIEEEAQPAGDIQPIEEEVVPPTEEDVAPPVEEEVVSPVEEEVVSPTEKMEEVIQPVEEKVLPPVEEEALPPIEEEQTPLVEEDDELPAKEEVVPPTEELEEVLPPTQKLEEVVPPTNEEQDPPTKELEEVIPPTQEDQTPPTQKDEPVPPTEEVEEETKDEERAGDDNDKVVVNDKDTPYDYTPESELDPETPTEYYEAIPDATDDSVADSVSVGPLPPPPTDFIVDENTLFWGDEKLVVTSRKLSSMGDAIVDNPDALSVELAEAVTLKAVGLRNEFRVLPKICADNKTIMPSKASFHSQAGIVKAARWKRSPNGEDLMFRMEVWTARHNVLNDVVREDGTSVSSGISYVHSSDNTFEKELTKAKNKAKKKAKNGKKKENKKKKKKKNKESSMPGDVQAPPEYPSSDTSATTASTIPTDGLMTRRHFASYLVRKDLGIDDCCDFIDAGKRARRCPQIRIGGDLALLDITSSSQQYRHFELGKEKRLFERVRDNFWLKPGIRIGMAVYNMAPVTPDAVSGRSLTSNSSNNTDRDSDNMSEAANSHLYSTAGSRNRDDDLLSPSTVSLRPTETELEELYGHPGQIVVHTGTILHVNPIHIQHDINCYGGCAGAVLFLLDKDQPGSVKEEDYGKAIGIQAGKHPDPQITRNIAFKFPQEQSTLDKLKDMVQ